MRFEVENSFIAKLWSENKGGSGPEYRWRENEEALQGPVDLQVTIGRESKPVENEREEEPARHGDKKPRLGDPVAAPDQLAPGRQDLG
jgi:hypothetical protein